MPLVYLGLGAVALALLSGFFVAWLGGGSQLIGIAVALVGFLAFLSGVGWLAWSIAQRTPIETRPGGIGLVAIALAGVVLMVVGALYPSPEENGSPAPSPTPLPSVVAAPADATLSPTSTPSGPAPSSSTNDRPEPTLASFADVGAEIFLLIVSSDLTVGPNSFFFEIVDELLQPSAVPEAKATFVFLETTPFQPGVSASASYMKWASREAGIYVADVSFDRPGRWGVIVEISRDDGTVAAGRAAFLVGGLDSATASPSTSTSSLPVVKTRGPSG